MGFLTGLFQQSAPELQVAEDLVEADASVEPGYLYRVTGSDSPIVIALRPHALADVAGVRFAVKVFTAAPTPPGGTLTVTVPTGQLIEDDAGELALGVAFEGQVLGTYREWLCDTEGTWMLVNRVDPVEPG